MNNNNYIFTELESLAPVLAAMPKVNVYSVPQGYFEGLAELIAGNIKEKGNVLPAAINTMDVPAGYFDSLADNILLKIHKSELSEVQTELQELSPVLFEAGNKNVFSVPTGYFESLTDQILSNRPPLAKVISMRPRATVFKYAIAAVITGLLGLSVFSVFNNKGSFNFSGETNTLVLAEANQIIATNSFDKVLETITDEEIVGYLENSGQDVNAALVASAAFSKELPSSDAYIIDDNALNNFLDELNLKNEYNN